MQAMEDSRRRYYIAAALLVAVAVYVAFGAEIAKTTKPWNDEAMAASAAYNLSTEGHTGVRFFDDKSPLFPGIRQHSYYIFPFQLCVLAVWYKIVGFSLLTTRLISVLWTLVILGALYSFLKGLSGDRSIAALAILLTAFDYHMLASAAFGRYDPMVAALGYSSYSLYIYLRERNLTAALLASNACLMMAGATHPNALVYLVSLWFMIFYFDRKRIGIKHLAVAAIPFIIGGCLWARFILADLPSFRGQLSMNAGGRVGLLHPYATLMREIQVRYLTEFGLAAHSSGHNFSFVRLKAIRLFLYFGAVAICLLIPKIRNDQRYRPLFVIFGIHWFYMTFYENMKFSFYLVHLTPLFCALVSIAGVTLWRSRSTVMRFAVAGAVAAALAIPIGGMLLKIRLDDYRQSYLPAVEFVEKIAHPDDLVAATCSFGFGYGFDKNFIDDPSLGFYNHRVPDILVAEEIYDGWWKERITFQPDVYEYSMRMLRDYDLVYDVASYRVYVHRGGTRAVRQ